MTVSTVPYALVVEDDPFILMDASDILEEAGFRILSSAHGDGAKPILEQNGPSIVLLFTDVEMPGSTNGIALAQYTAARWPEIAIVVSSGHVTPKGEQMPKGSVFIPKPFNAELVRAHLQDILPGGGRRFSSDAPSSVCLELGVALPKQSTTRTSPPR